MKATIAIVICIICSFIAAFFCLGLPSLLHFQNYAAASADLPGLDVLRLIAAIIAQGRLGRGSDLSFDASSVATNLHRLAKALVFDRLEADSAPYLRELLALYGR